MTNYSYKKIISRLELLSCKYGQELKENYLEEIYGLLLKVNENGQDANHLRILMLDLEKKQKLKDKKDVEEKQEEIKLFIESLSKLYKKFDFSKKPLNIGCLNYLRIFLITLFATVIAGIILEYILKNK